MRRPKVSVANQAAIYEFYTKYRPNKVASETLQFVAGATFHPRVCFADGAEDEITGVFAESKPIVWASNHLRFVDSGHISALATRQPVLRPLHGNTFSLGMMPLFRHPVLRRVFDLAGTMPVFREQDLKKHEPAEDTNLIGSAGRRLIKTSTARLETGQNMFVFPEGECNRTDPLRVQALSRGIGLIVCGVKQISQPPIIPTGIYYSEKSGIYGRAPHVFIGRPSAEPFERATDVIQWLGAELQSCVDMAVVSAT